MLQDSLSKIKYLFVLAVLLVLPAQAMAQFGDAIPIIDQTDTGVNRLVYFFDTRDRDTFIQVTNTSSSTAWVHVQVFDVNGVTQICDECNFDLHLTGFDTDVLDVEDLDNCPLVNSYGFVVISLMQGPSNSLIGMFRIIDEAGYEYRTNAAGHDLVRLKELFSTTDEIVNFSLANGHNLSDLVGITFVEIDSGFVYASPFVGTTFGQLNDSILIYDEFEIPTSCSPETFTCDIGHFDQAIDFSLPNSKGQNNFICPTAILDSFDSGWVHLPFAEFTCAGDGQVSNEDGSCAFRPFFVGFLGLNNGDGTGSMDSLWEEHHVSMSEDDGPSL